jgi:sugar phosphate isomerase/epimerase
MFTAETWPIACNMLPFGSTASDGTPIRDAPARVWAGQLAQVKALGFTHVDPTDAWVPVAELNDARLAEFKQVLADEGLAVSSISMTRRSVVDKQRGDEFLALGHRLIDLAPDFGATVVNTGFMQALTEAQQGALWFWLAQGHKDDPDLRDTAISRIRELGDHAASAGVQISLEMYEDTYVGTAHEAAQFIRDLDHSAVGLNPDIGNLIRLHRPMPPFMEMFEEVLPYSNFWHIKNYMRDEDPTTGAYASAPLPLAYGIINYRTVIRRALELGYAGPFVCEHYGSDSLGVCAQNAEYIRGILRSALES